MPRARRPPADGARSCPAPLGKICKDAPAARTDLVGSVENEEPVITLLADAQGVVGNPRASSDDRSQPPDLRPGCLGSVSRNRWNPWQGPFQRSTCRTMLDAVLQQPSRPITPQETTDGH